MNPMNRGRLMYGPCWMMEGWRFWFRKFDQCCVVWILVCCALVHCTCRIARVNNGSPPPRFHRYIMSQAKFWKANTGGSNKRTLIRLFFIFADGHDNSASQQKFNSEWERTKAILAPKVEKVFLRSCRKWKISWNWWKFQEFDVFGHVRIIGIPKEILSVF